MNIGVFKPQSGIGSQVVNCLKGGNHKVIPLEQDDILDVKKLELFDSLVIDHRKWQISVGLMRYLDLLKIMDTKNLILISYKKEPIVKGRNSDKITLNIISSQLKSEMLLDSLAKAN